MLKQIVIFFALICAVTAACGKVPAACADWRGPIVIPQQPQFQPPQPQPPQPLPRNFLEPTLKSIPPAPQAVTGNGQGNSEVGGGHDNSAAEPARKAGRPVPPPVEEPVQPQVSMENTPPIRAQEPSKPITPWLLAAGVAAAAFLLGRRSR